MQAPYRRAPQAVRTVGNDAIAFNGGNDLDMAPTPQRRRTNMGRGAGKLVP